MKREKSKLELGIMVVVCWWILNANHGFVVARDGMGNFALQIGR